jgi:hypothetical protein
MVFQFYHLAEEFAKGNQDDKGNALPWDHVVLNLPGDPVNDPNLPHVMKWEKIINKIAGNIVAFVDDHCASAHLVERTWGILRQVVSRLQYLGLQDAPRKQRLPVCIPVAWAGSVFNY